MKDEKVKIFPLGDSALTVSFGNEISIELNENVQKLDAALKKNPFNGLIELVPAYSSLSIFYDLFTVKNCFCETESAFEAVKLIAESALLNLAERNNTKQRIVEIPVDFGNEFTLDLRIVASSNELSESEVIEIFLAKTYRVFLLGFLPGFAYMGEVDNRIGTPRKESPRLKVPKGSVGIAGKQTGIYPLESPGGWQIIGKTDVEMFTPEADSPTFLQPGDEVKFVR